MTSLSPDNEIEVINRVIIIGMVTVEHPANPHGGIPLRLLANGLLPLLVEPWTQQAEYDDARILLSNSDIPVLNKTIMPGEVNQPFTLNLPEALLSNGINQIRLSVLRVGQTIPETSQSLDVLFHRPTAGGRSLNPRRQSQPDPHPALRGHHQGGGCGNGQPRGDPYHPLSLHEGKRRYHSGP